MAIFIRNEESKQLELLKIPFLKGEKGDQGLKGDTGNSGVFVGSVSNAPTDANIVVDNSNPGKYANLFDRVDYDYQGIKRNSIKEVNDANVEYLINKEKNLVTIPIIDSTLNLTTDKWQYATMENNTTITLPQVDDFTEIHLFFRTNGELSLTLPLVTWEEQPVIDKEGVYEFIFTYVKEWIGGYVPYNE